MTVLRRTAGVITALAVIACLADCGQANYRFDDLLGSSGKSYQWVVINNAGDTFGDSHTEAIDVSGDVLNSTTSVLNVLSGKSEEAISDQSLHTLFFVTANGEGNFTMNFRAPEAQQFEINTPNLQLSTPYDEQETTRRLYIDTKTSAGRPTGKDYYDDLWRSYNFTIMRQDARTEYDTVAQYFYFLQDPTETSSQGIPRPFVIANVHPGTAADDPYSALEMRLTLRDGASNNSNIVAYDKTRWSMTGPKSAGGRQWVFVPVDNLDIGNSRINYYLTTEVVNHCSARYAAYEGSTRNWLFPRYWKFDILRLNNVMDIERQVFLAEQSHIVPGLVTVYNRTWNVNETSKIPLTLYAIDDTGGNGGVYPLTLNHRIIYGKRLGPTYTRAASEGGFNSVEVTAFQPRPGTGTAFYDNVARLSGSTKTVASPTTNIFTASSVKHDASALTSRAEIYFTVDQAIPSSLRSSSTEGILPMHVVMNLPVTRMQASVWETLLRESRRSTDGNINDSFSDYYHIYAMVKADDGSDNPWDLTEELMKHDGQLKVFIDEERGRITQDNDRGLVTVSFMLMLMNGTRDGSRPMITYTPDIITVPDNTDGEEIEYVVVRDGNNDTRWNMTFFLAPADYFNNPPADTNTQSQTTEPTSSSGGGGGCNIGASLLVASAFLFILRRK